MNAASPLLFCFTHDVQLIQDRHQHLQRASTIDANLLVNLLSQLESKLAIVTVETPCRRLKLAGILVTLLRAFSGCMRQRKAIFNDGDVKSTAEHAYFATTDKKRLKLNMPMCTRLIEMLKLLCDHERHSAAIKTLVYSAMPAVCRANPRVEASVVRMLMSRIEACNSFGVGYAFPQLITGTVSPLSGGVQKNPCVQLATLTRDDGAIETVAVLVEPIDVILQSLDLCLRSHCSAKWPPATTNIDARSSAVRALEAMSHAYLRRDDSVTVIRLVEQHLRDLQDKCEQKNIAGAPLTPEALLSVRMQCLQIAYQLELGIVEALIEHTLMREAAKADTYANVSLLLSRHEAIRSLFNARLEGLRREQERISVTREQKVSLCYSHIGSRF